MHISCTIKNSFDYKSRIQGWEMVGLAMPVLIGFLSYKSEPAEEI